MMIIVVLVVLQAFLQSSDAACKCGQEDLSRRVINGREAEKNRYPWMVSVMAVKTRDESGRPTNAEACGGSLITDRHVLTAAHCLAHKEGDGDSIKYATIDSLRIVMGAHTTADRWFKEPLPVSSIIVHEKYVPGVEKMSDDIAIIELAKPVAFDNVVNPVCLPDYADYEEGSLFLIGWGNQNENKKVVAAAALFEVSPPEHSNDTCIELFGDVKFVPEKEICAGDERGNCQGDSGGPLSTRKDGYVYQVGITSYTVTGCNVESGANTPGVYERVTGHLKWIKDHTRGGKWCAAPHHPFAQ